MERVTARWPFFFPMRSYTTEASAAEILSQLPVFRRQYTSGQPAGQRVEAAVGLVELYVKLRLFDRAESWLRAVSPLSEQELEPQTVVRFRLAAASVWLERGDVEAASRALDKLKGAELGLEEERQFLAASVRLALLGDPATAFAPLEKALRHLRHHPSPLWSARFLLWRAQWQQALDRQDDVPGTLKKAVAEAVKSGDREAQLQAWLAVATSPFIGKAKALRAARTAQEKAVEWAMPLAATEAAWALGSLAVSRETESTRAFRAHWEGVQGWGNQEDHWDRSAREEDETVFVAFDQGQRRRDSSLLAAIASHLAGDANLSRSLDELYQPLCSLMPADVFGIALWAPDQQALDYALFIEEGRRTRVGLIPIDSTRSLGAWCFRARKAVRINDIDREYGTYLKELSRLTDHRPKSMLFQPLMGEGRALGIITVQSFARDSYGPEDESHLAVVAACVALRLQAGSRSPDVIGEASRD